MSTGSPLLDTEAQILVPQPVNALSCQLRVPLVYFLKLLSVSVLHPSIQFFISLWHLSVYSAPSLSSKGMDLSWDFETLKEDLEGWNSIILRSTGLSPFLSETFFLSHLTPHPSTRQSANDLVSLRAVLRMPKPLRFSAPSSEEWGKDHFLHPMTSTLYWSYYNHVGAITSGVAGAVIRSLTLCKVPRGQWRRWVDQKPMRESGPYFNHYSLSRNSSYFLL